MEISHTRRHRPLLELLEGYVGATMVSFGYAYVTLKLHPNVHTSDEISSFPFPCTRAIPASWLETFVPASVISQIKAPLCESLASSVRARCELDHRQFETYLSRGWWR